MNQSENINELVSALSKAQGVMEPAKFNKTNPHFRNKYADFKSCIDACRKPLSDNGLSIMQYCESSNNQTILVTMLAHTSGQWIKSNLPLLMNKQDCQSLGSAMTYMKRYGLSGMLGIVADEDNDDDDDGEIAQGRVVNSPKQLSVQKNEPKPVAPLLSAEQVSSIVRLCNADQNLIDKICTVYSVKSLEHISSDLYEIIMKKLQAQKVREKS